MLRFRTALGLLLCWTAATPCLAQVDAFVGEWNLRPDYRLERRAADRLSPRFDPMFPEPAMVRLQARPLLLKGQEPTHTQVLAELPPDLLAGDFTLDLWLVNHVNQPVGALAALRHPDGLPAIALGYIPDGIGLYWGQEGLSGEAKIPRGWKRYWHHVALVKKGDEMAVYHNGVSVLEGKDGLLPPDVNPLQLEVSAYLASEPYMETANLLKSVRLVGKALTEEEVSSRFETLRARVEQGRFYDSEFHFTVEPYLNLAGDGKMPLTWETDRPASAILKYGTALPLDQEIRIAEAKNIHQTVVDLVPGQRYFYQLEASDREGHTIRTGVLTARMPPIHGEPLAFAVIGDTEGRPHINHQIAKQLWDQRPDLVLNVGDLTDGGQTEHKFEWNLEYFEGIGPLHGRIPVYPVAGNGESDLRWFSAYHRLPNDGAYYSFKAGDAEFFMLDSNKSEEEFKPGGKQYEWLKSGLEASTAKWKFAAHHHPVYTSDEDDYGDSWREDSYLGDPDVRPLEALYHQHGVDVVFYGHLHTYERTRPVRGGLWTIEAAWYMSRRAVREAIWRISPPPGAGLPPRRCAATTT